MGDCKRVLRQLVEAVREELKDGIPPAVERGAPAVGGADRGVEARLPAPLRVERRRHQAAVRHPGDLQPDARRGLHGHRRGPAPDVGGPVLPVQAPAARGAPRAGSAPWATGCPPPWACRRRNPGKLVINIDGDGSFAMNSQELATCFTEEPARQDRHHQQQRPRHGAAVAADHLQGALLRHRPAAASRTGSSWPRPTAASGIRVTKPSEVVPALEKMLSTPAPVVLDVCVDKDECVFPMVPAGGANTDMILAPPQPRSAGTRRQVADGLLASAQRGRHASTRSRSWWRTSSACSRAWPGSSRRAATTSRACRWGRRSTRRCRA